MAFEMSTSMLGTFRPWPSGGEEAPEMGFFKV